MKNALKFWPCCRKKSQLDVSAKMMCGNRRMSRGHPAVKLCQETVDSVVGYIKAMKAVEERIAEYEINR